MLNKITFYQEIEGPLRIVAHTNNPYNSIYNTSQEESKTCKAKLWKQKQSTPRTRWINTVQPSKQPCCSLCMYQIQRLFLVTPDRIENLNLWISWKCAGTSRVSNGICFVVAFTCGFYNPSPPHRKAHDTRCENKQGNIWSQQLTIIWISRLHTCRSCSLLTYILFRAQRTPWFVRTRNTIAKPPAASRKRPNQRDDRHISKTLTVGKNMDTHWTIITRLNYNKYNTYKTWVKLQHYTILTCFHCIMILEI